jgi:hypothetical protein
MATRSINPSVGLNAATGRVIEGCGLDRDRCRPIRCQRNGHHSSKLAVYIQLHAGLRCDPELIARCHFGGACVLGRNRRDTLCVVER